ncbi:MAG: hypothetical protein ACOC9N_03505, partial [Gemmatimonadota bacterium]
MTTIQRDVRLRVYAPGQSEIESEGGDPADFTLTVDALADLPELPGPTVRPLEGKTETNRGTFRVVDVDGPIVSNLGDEDGRAQHLGRLVEVQVDDDDAGFETVAVGRLAYLSEPDGPGEFAVQVADERWGERRDPIFATTDNAQLYPAGPTDAWRDVPAAGTARLRVIAVTSASGGDWVLFRPDVTAFPADVVEAILADRKAGQPLVSEDTDGNFESLRLEVEGTDRPIRHFDATFNTTRGMGTLDPDAETDPTFTAVWAFFSTGAPSVGDVLQGRLYFTEPVPVSENLPRYVGGEDGLRIHALIQALADGDFGGDALRYDDDVVSGLADLPDLPPVWLRVREPKRRGPWMDTNIFAPFLVAAFGGANGRVAPRSLRMLQGTDPATLFRFDADNIDHEAGPPTWALDGAEAVTGVALTYRSVNRFGDAFGGVSVETRTIEPTLEGAASVGRAERTFETELFFASRLAAKRLHEALERYIVERFGDGPQRGEMVGLESTGSVEPGDHVVIDQDELKGPNAQENAREGDRVVQILEKTRRLTGGYHFRYLDAGPALQPLAAPTVAIARNADDEKHTVDVTLSNLPSGTVGQIELAYGDTEPADDGDWRSVHPSAGEDTHSFPDQPSGTKVWARAFSRTDGRIRSAYSDADDVTTEALSAPTIGTPDVDGRDVTIPITPGESTYPMRVELDGEPVRGENGRPVVLSAGVESYTLRGLDESTTYDDPGVQVYHVDDFGGESAKDTETFTTGVTPDAPRPAGLDVRTVFDLSGLRVHPAARIWLFAADAAFRIQVLMADDDSGTNAEIVADVAGTTRELRRSLAGVGSTKYFAIRHVRDGWDDSPLTCWRPANLADLDSNETERHPIPAVIRVSASDDTLTIVADDAQCRVTAVEWSTDGGGEWS